MFSSSIENAMATTSVEINGIYIRFNRAVDALVRFCRPLVFHNEETPFELSLVGSSFRIRYAQKMVLVTTKHQLGCGKSVRAPNEACILLQEGLQTVALTCSGFGMPQFPEGTDSRVREDILFLQFASDKHNLPPHFFDISHIRTMLEVPQEKIILYFAIGFPTEFTELGRNFDDPDKFSFEGYISRFGKIYLETERQISMPAHIEFRVHQKQPITIDDFDGLSGSPVFFIIKTRRSNAISDSLG
jgi:hypothetical protein